MPHVAVIRAAARAAVRAAGKKAFQEVVSEAFDRVRDEIGDANLGQEEAQEIVSQVSQEWNKLHGGSEGSTRSGSSRR